MYAPDPNNIEDEDEGDVPSENVGFVIYEGDEINLTGEKLLDFSENHYPGIDPEFDFLQDPLDGLDPFEPYLDLTPHEKEQAYESGQPSSDQNMYDSAHQMDWPSSNSSPETSKSPQISIIESKPLIANSSQQLPSINYIPSSFPVNFYTFNVIPNSQCTMNGYYNPMNPQNNLSGLPHCISGYCAANDYASLGLSKFIGFLQYKISGDKNIRFRKEKLHALYEIFQEKFHWKKLDRKDKRNKQHVFKKLYQHKDLVKYLIQTCPEVYLNPIIITN